LGREGAQKAGGKKSAMGSRKEVIKEGRVGLSVVVGKFQFLVKVAQRRGCGIADLVEAENGSEWRPDHRGTEGTRRQPGRALGARMVGRPKGQDRVRG
jgi:hypothetical protein